MVPTHNDRTPTKTGTDVGLKESMCLGIWVEVTGLGSIECGRIVGRHPKSCKVELRVEIRRARESLSHQPAAPLSFQIFDMRSQMFTRTKTE